MDGSTDVMAERKRGKKRGEENVERWKGEHQEPASSEALTQKVALHLRKLPQPRSWADALEFVGTFPI